MTEAHRLNSPSERVDRNEDEEPDTVVNEDGDHDEDDTMNNHSGIVSSEGGHPKDHEDFDGFEPNATMDELSGAYLQNMIESDNLSQAQQGDDFHEDPETRHPSMYEDDDCQAQGGRAIVNNDVDEAAQSQTRTRSRTASPTDVAHRGREGKENGIQRTGGQKQSVQQEEIEIDLQRPLQRIAMDDLESRLQQHQNTRNNRFEEHSNLLSQMIEEYIALMRVLMNRKEEWYLKQVQETAYAIQEMEDDQGMLLHHARQHPTSISDGMVLHRKFGAIREFPSTLLWQSHAHHRMYHSPFCDFCRTAPCQAARVLRRHSQQYCQFPRISAAAGSGNRTITLCCAWRHLHGVPLSRRETNDWTLLSFSLITSASA
ncbi:uncharacterized protein EV422DRAFT_535420 [Fimicolochytrium jonesii]|uniref:uncharacterized protein n=1 Tax=Fimicolochytrium jonesii TaxID=1396493 RepID=UPI0022FF45C8|nr:uncharacterized protein EV422DRAFT_535420 [Fimicolochytrium jonesii]KAI8819189.1 hypothetical protein EV422DRAFT_535420 [Fimicolochytrium jonesii]